ncbi:MAG: hypothetical protein KC550_01890 [Nanoarchaeota archaeon]|nr:hypothetical protein [Nanoarchaeota archaeon]
METKEILMVGTGYLSSKMFAIMQEYPTNSRFKFKHLDELLPEEFKGTETGFEHYINQISAGKIPKPDVVIWCPHRKDKPDFFERLKNVNFQGETVLMYADNKMPDTHGIYASKLFNLYTQGFVAHLPQKLNL